MFEALFLFVLAEGADPAIWRGAGRVCDTLRTPPVCEVLVSSEMYPTSAACSLEMARIQADFRARARDGLTMQIACVRQSRADYERERRRRGEFEA